MKNFTKNDNAFICQNCGKEVSPLGYTSRNHCPHCLCSIHVDIMPGDRQNSCRGLQEPVAIEYNPKKGYVIVYKCSKCGAVTKNKSAEDDNFEKILEIAKKYSNSF